MHLQTERTFGCVHGHTFFLAEYIPRCPCQSRRSRRWRACGRHWARHARRRLASNARLRVCSHSLRLLFRRYVREGWPVDGPHSATPCHRTPLLDLAGPDRQRYATEVVRIPSQNCVTMFARFGFILFKKHGIAWAAATDHRHQLASAATLHLRTFALQLHTIRPNT